jgi:hypothetical protein
MSFPTKAADQTEVSHRMGRPAWWFAGIVVSVLLAWTVADLGYLFAVHSGGITFQLQGYVVALFTVVAAYCAYRLGKLWT